MTISDDRKRIGNVDTLLKFSKESKMKQSHDADRIKHFRSWKIRNGTQKRGETVRSLAHEISKTPYTQALPNSS